MEKDFNYGQIVVPIKRTYPLTDIKKPFANPGLVIGVSQRDNLIDVQVITPLYKTKNFLQTGENEIDLIHFAVRNTPRDRLNTLHGTEIMHLLTESAQIAVDKINEVIAEKYPMAKSIKHYTHDVLKRTWDVTVQRNRNNPDFPAWGDGFSLN